MFEEEDQRILDMAQISTVVSAITVDISIIVLNLIIIIFIPIMIIIDISFIIYHYYFFHYYYPFYDLYYNFKVWQKNLIFARRFFFVVRKKDCSLSSFHFVLDFSPSKVEALL